MYKHDFGITLKKGKNYVFSINIVIITASAQIKDLIMIYWINLI